MRPTPQIVYFSVKNTSEKLRCIIETAQNHLHRKNTLHILVPDKTSLSFVSQLLWKEPKEGFIVHNDDRDPLMPALIQLMLPQPSYTNAESIFNLTSHALIGDHPLKQIYELEDLSHPNKKDIFQKKFQLYQEAGYSLCSN